MPRASTCGRPGKAKRTPRSNERRDDPSHARPERATVAGMQHPGAALEAARLRLARLAVDEKQSLARVFARATRLIARTLDVERVGIWLFESERASLRCVCLYQRTTDEHGTGAVIDLAGVPAYRAALEERRAIVAHDASTDPATAELRDE